MNDETICIGAVVVAILMVGGLALLTWWDERDNDDGQEEEILFVQEGDEISVDYTGRFLGSGDDLGAIFDTSIPEDARNESIPKSLSFKEKATYDDLTFTVGSGQMIAGFDKGVLGMTVGSTKYVTVFPEDGYGVLKPELILEIQTIEAIPLREEITREEFQMRFPLIDPEVETSFNHPFWGWEVKILESDPASVSLINQPAYLENYGEFPWNVTVTDISTSDNRIQITHQIDEIEKTTMVDFSVIGILYPEWNENAMEASGEAPPEPGFVESTGGVITINFNREVVGKTLVFKITVNDIKRG